MIRLLQSHWMIALVGTLLYLGTTFLLWRLPDGLPSAPTHHSNLTPPSGPSWDFSHPELDQLIRELQDEKLALAKRQRDLDDLAARLEIERTEFTHVIRAVEQLQLDFDRDIIRVQSEEIANLKKLAKLYSSMDPAGAALILQKLEDAALVKILTFMKEVEAAPILEAIAQTGDVESRRVADLTERLRLILFREPAAATGL
jgi:hypothetical protein